MAFVTSLLALVTFCSVTKKSNDPISVVLPKLTEASTIAKTSVCHVRELSMAFLTSLVTLGSVTKDSNDPISVVLPKVTKARTLA
jgi:hypothetical protein